MSHTSSISTTPNKVVDLIHFMNYIAKYTSKYPNNKQCTNKEMLSESCTKEARMIVLGFVIPNNKAKNVL